MGARRLFWRSESSGAQKTAAVSAEGSSSLSLLWIRMLYSTIRLAGASSVFTMTHLPAHILATSRVKPDSSVPDFCCHRKHRTVDEVLTRSKYTISIVLAAATKFSPTPTPEPMAWLV
ncbi:hypothetical protein DFH06DRAFT_1152738 [Mycena polygramma]|nr:hypothetical protein DFH06DRAFT_1152738 [Mycena polygramma]